MSGLMPESHSITSFRLCRLSLQAIRSKKILTMQKKRENPEIARQDRQKTRIDEKNSGKGNITAMIFIYTSRWFRVVLTLTICAR